MATQLTTARPVLARVFIVVILQGMRLTARKDREIDVRLIRVWDDCDNKIRICKTHVLNSWWKAKEERILRLWIKQFRKSVLKHNSLYAIRTHNLCNTGALSTTKRRYNHDRSCFVNVLLPNSDNDATGNIIMVLLRSSRSLRGGRSYRMGWLLIKVRPYRNSSLKASLVLLVKRQ